MRLFAPITKLDQEQRLVFGYASTEALDSQGEIIKREAIEAALPDYMRFANIREMHQPSAVGVAEVADVDERGLYLAAKVVDDDAWRKVKEGVYRGFSIGGKVTTRDPADRRVITGLELSEISLVDRPANPEAIIDLYKRDAVPAWETDLADRVASDPDKGAAAESPLRMDAPDIDVAKIGARNSQADLARIQRVHDAAVELGATCPAAARSAGGAKAALTSDPPGGADTLRKIAGMEARLATLAAAVEEQGRLLERVAAQPAPPKYATDTRPVAKERDGFVKAEEDEPKTALDAIRKAHRNPLHIELA